MRKHFSDGEIRVKQVISDLMDETGIKLFTKSAAFWCKKPMAKELTSKEYESIEQIRVTNPFTPYLSPEDFKPKRLPTDTIRPFSAKVHRPPKVPNMGILRQKAGNSKKKSNRSMVGSSRNLTYSSHSIKKQIKAGGGVDCINERKFIPLSINVEQEDESDKWIEKLRKIKTKAEEYEKQKQNFMLEIHKDKEEYANSLKRVASALSRKQFTYSYNGAIVEIAKAKGMKKKSRNMMTMKNCDRKSEAEANNEEMIVVSYHTNELKNQKKKYIFEELQYAAKQNSLKELESGKLKFCLVAEPLQN